VTAKGGKEKKSAWKRREKGEGEENGEDYGNKGWSLRGISIGKVEGKKVGKQKERVIKVGVLGETV
jgi:hypothetical protein